MDFLSGQLSLVLLLDAETLQFTQLLLLDGLDFTAFSVHLCSQLAALLEVVQAIVLLLVRVVQNLVTDALGVVVLCFAALFVQHAVVLLLLLLLLDDAQERVALGLSLFSHHNLALEELLLASHLKLIYLP